MLVAIVITVASTIAYISTIEKGISRNEKLPEILAQRERFSSSDQSQGIVLGNGIRLESTESSPSH